MISSCFARLRLLRSYMADEADQRRVSGSLNPHWVQR
jgi:hypothetical protein